MCASTSAKCLEEKQLSRTNIIETLVERRDTAAKELGLALNPSNEEAAKELLSDEFGPAPSSKPKKSVIHFDEQQVLTVQAPSVKGVDGIPVRVLFTTVKSALYAEATTPMLRYLRAACAAQISDGTVKRFGKRKRDSGSGSQSVADNSQSADP